MQLAKNAVMELQNGGIKNRAKIPVRFVVP